MSPAQAAASPAAPAAAGGVHLVFDDADFAGLAAAMRQACRPAPSAAAPSLRVLVQRSAASRLEEALDRLDARPPLTLEPFDEEDDGIRRANASRGELTRSVWSDDIARAFRVASGFEADAVWINDWGRIAYASSRPRDPP